MNKATAQISTLVGCLLFAIVLSQTAFAGTNETVSANISRIGDASQIELSGAADWKYDIKRDPKSPDRVILHVSGMKPESMTKLRAYKDGVIQNVKVDENGVDGMAEIAFSVGEKTDFFDYMTDQPSRLILDFFPKDPKDFKADARPQLKPQAPHSAQKVTRTLKPIVKHANDQEGNEDDDVKDTIFTNNKLDISEQITGIAGAKVSGLNKAESRKPAGDLPLMGQKEDAPSLAESVSSEQGFSHGIFDGGDPEFKRFSVKDFEVKEEAVIASRANFYLPFPSLSLGIPQLEALVEAKSVYEIVPNETRENKEARVLMALFTGGKHALLMKTADEFLRKYSSSNYDEIVRYMVGDTYYDLWRKEGSQADFDRAMNIYQLLTEKYPGSPATPRSLLLMAYSYMDRGDSFGALKSFQRFTRVSPSSKHIDQVNISIAEAYLRLNRFDDAYNMLDQIEKNAKTLKMRQEAAFRKGDVYFRKKDFNEAIAQYKAAIARFPEAATSFANAPYNIAEAQFILGHHKEALDSYRSFLQKFPDNDHGGYAMTRIGELLGIMGADNKRALGAFLESYFRYRSSPGAGIARIRLLAARMPEMKDKELASALKEITEITAKYANHPLSKKAEDEKKAQGEKPKVEAKAEGKAGEGGEKGKTAEPEAGTAEASDLPPEKPLELDGIEDFSALLVADGYNARHEYDTAVKDLIGYFQKNPQTVNKEKIKVRIVKNMTEAIRTSVDRGDFIDALRRWSRDSVLWLKNTDRVDVRYSVGRAYELAGVFKEAANVYRENIKQLAEIQSSGKGKEHTVFEVLPKNDQLNLRLAAVAVKEKDFGLAETYLKNISSSPNLNEPEQIERAEVSADVAEARGQAELAGRYMGDLIKAWKGNPELTGPLHLRIARMQAAKKNYKEADAHLARIIEMRNENGKVPDEVYAKALEMRGENYISRGKPADALKTFTALLEQFESKRQLASIRYRVGQIQFQEGDLKAAQSTWGGLSSDKDGLWAHLAQEQMQGAKWQREYKKYLDRIPAAEGMR